MDRHRRFQAGVWFTIRQGRTAAALKVSVVGVLGWRSFGGDYGIVGLSLNPPEKAVVLCVDEKTQVQALDRTQPVRPMGLGCVEAVTHDTIRHDTTTLFAALDVATDQVNTPCKPRHRQPLARMAAPTGIPESFSPD
jgi:hypothetical protein